MAIAKYSFALGEEGARLLLKCIHITIAAIPIPKHELATAHGLSAELKLFVEDIVQTEREKEKP